MTSTSSTNKYSYEVTLIDAYERACVIKREIEAIHAYLDSLFSLHMRGPSDENTAAKAKLSDYAVHWRIKQDEYIALFKRLKTMAIMENKDTV